MAELHKQIKMNTNKTLNIIEQTIIKEMDLRNCNAILTNDRGKLGRFAEVVIAYKLGKPLKLGPRDDQRSLKIDQTIVQGLKAIATMFRLNENLKYARYATLFDLNGWRSTSWEELGRIGSGRARSASFTRAQIRSFLKVLERTGFIDRKNVFNAGKNQRRLFIRFRPDRILQAIDEVTDLRKAGVEPTKVVNHDHPIRRESGVAASGNDEIKADPVEAKAPPEAITSAMHDPIFITKGEVPADCAGGSDLVADSSKPDTPGDEKMNSAGRRPADEIFSFPEHFGNPELMQMIDIIMLQFDMGEITWGQARTIKKWYNSSSERSHMDLKILEDFFETANGMWSSVRTYRPKPDYFIKAWPLILREHRRNVLEVDGLSLADHHLASASDAAVDAEIRAAVKWFCEHTPEWEASRGSPIDVSFLAKSGHNMIIEFAALVQMRRDELLKEYLALRRDKLLEQLQSEPLWLLGLKRVMPEIFHLIQADESFWNRARRAKHQHYQAAAANVYRARACGLQQHNI